jgi:hypothetical protein
VQHHYKALQTEALTNLFFCSLALAASGATTGLAAPVSLGPGQAWGRHASIGLETTTSAGAWWRPGRGWVNWQLTSIMNNDTVCGNVTGNLTCDPAVTCDLQSDLICAIAAGAVHLVFLHTGSSSLFCSVLQMW